MTPFLGSQKLKVVSYPAVFSGMVLNSDLSSMTKRLREIGASIRNLRDYRLSIPSDEYFRYAHVYLGT